jgi:hypothetical protein
LHRLEENLSAANVELTGRDLAEIERAASEIKVPRERYPEHPWPPPAAKRLRTSLVCHTWHKGPRA